MKNILLTGFEPYGSTKINPAHELVKNLDGKIINNTVLTSKIVPNNFYECVEVVRKNINKIIKNNSLKEFKAILMFGEYPGRPFITIERIAQNINDSKRYGLSDNKSISLQDKPTVIGGPAAFYSTLPLRSMVKAMRNNGVPCDISDSAGTFCCNHLMYGILHYLENHKINIPAGFIHLPQLPEIAALDENIGTPSMSVKTMQKGMCAAITALLNHPKDSDETIASNL